MAPEGHTLLEDARIDDEAFRKLFVTLARPVHRLFRRMGFPEDFCRDLTQETFLRVYRGSEGFRGHASEKTWVFKIAVHVGSNARREQHAGKRRGTLVAIEDTPETALDAKGSSADRRGTLGALIDKELLDRVLSAISGLPPQMQRCLTLYVDQGLKYREIAVIMRIAEGAVKSQIHEARRQLRETLGRAVSFVGTEEAEGS